MQNITIRFSSVEETKRMLKFLFENQAILANFKDDNNNIIGSKVNIQFTYALENQVPQNDRGFYLNMAMREIPPYIWKLGCFLSNRSTYREGLHHIMYFNDEKFKLVITPTGRGLEIHIQPDGMPVEKGIGIAWKFMQRHKEHNENVFKDLVLSWIRYERNNQIKGLPENTF